MKIEEFMNKKDAKNDSFRILEEGVSKLKDLDNNIENRLSINFSGNHWQMERMRVNQGVSEGIHLLCNELSGNNFSWNQACVPGDVYTDLYIAGEIEDPHYARNMAKIKWVEDYEWWYNYAFSVPSNLKGRRIELLFEGVDYSCTVYLNGKELGFHEGMFSSFSFDISTLVSFKKTHIPDNLLTVKLDPPPKNQKNFAGLKHNFSGDYLTGVIPFGIWKPVKLIITNETRLEEFRVETHIKEISAVNTPCEAEINILGSISRCENNSEVKVIISKDDCIYESERVKANKDYNIKLIYKDLYLWWPYDLGDQNLYNLKIQLLKDDILVDEIEKRVGFREITLKRNPGYSSEEVENPWTFVINGFDMFLRSACWGGQPSFFYGRNNYDKYKYFLLNAKEANINNLRIFGWHPPENDDFYSLCDELGITVWTNFPFATQVFRDDEIYLKKVYNEIKATVIDRRNHPSQIMWMGGEEVFFSEAHVESNNKQLMKNIGNVVTHLTNTPYADASPLSSREAIMLGYKTKESIHANSHYYAAGAVFMEDYYPNIDVCIIPELTAASAPSIESLKKFIPKDELWPPGLSWGYHAANMDLLETLNFEVFGKIKINKIEEFVKCSQIAQGIIFQYALENFRRRKPKVSGVSLCHFITNWPIIKWDIIDYYGVKKQSFYFVKNSYSLLLASAQYKKRRYLKEDLFSAKLYIVNDYYKQFDNLNYIVKIEKPVFKKEDNQSKEFNMKRIEAFDYNTNIKKQLLYNKVFKTSVNENTSVIIGEIDWRVNDVEDYFYLDLIIEDFDKNVLSSNSYIFIIDDQENAKNEAFKMYKNKRELREKYGRSYYRFALNCIDKE